MDVSLCITQHHMESALYSMECFHMTSRRSYWGPKTKKQRPMLVSQRNPVGDELFSYANAFFSSNKFVKMLAT